MMSRRISAGELEDRYKLKHKLYDFFDKMYSAIFRHFRDKGSSWKTCKKSYLLKKLKEHIKKEDWVDVANFAFFLGEREKMKRRK